MDTVRLDVWLDVACVYKTRAQAKAGCDGGKVTVNGARAKPHRELRAGDMLTITLSEGAQRELIVRALADRSLPKAEARKLYEDITPPPSPEAVAMARLDRSLRVEPGGRPTARQRRDLRKFKGR